VSSKMPGRSRDQAPARRRLPRPEVENVHAPIGPHPADAAIQWTRRDPRALGPRQVLHLQRTVGNHAVGQLLTGTIQRSKGKTKVDRSNKDLPAGPSIAATASRGSRWGAHANVFLAKGKPRKMEYYKIDLTYGEHGNLGSSARSGKSVSGRHGKRLSKKEKGIKIQIQEATAWAEPKASATWRIKNHQAQKAYDQAEHFQKNQKKYWYSPWGIGWRGYNCARFAEKIVKAAGVKATAGWLIKTPSELVSGKKWGMMSLRTKSKETQALIRQALRELEQEQQQQQTAPQAI
jgi:hypothetical protein